MGKNASPANLVPGTAPMWRNARWGMLVVDAQSGDTLLSRDADHLFMPASNQKLLTGAVANGDRESIRPAVRVRPANCQRPTRIVG